jgi:hypothetical protein
MALAIALPSGTRVRSNCNQACSSSHSGLAPSWRIWQTLLTTQTPVIGLYPVQPGDALNGLRGHSTRIGLDQFVEHPPGVGQAVRSKLPPQARCRCRLWKVAWQELAVRLAMPIHVCLFPPGTSKWNKIEHRMFATLPKIGGGDPW